MPTQEPSERPSERLVARDARVDHIGFVSELQKHFVEPLKLSVKGKMADRGLDVCEGDLFTALLVAGGVVSTVDPAKFLKLYESKKINKAEFLSAIRVSNEPCTAFLSGKELEAISETKPAASQLRVTRKKGVEIKLVDAVKGLAEAVGQ